ncbi:helix-turn-helix domain-containing protein [Natronolimnobius baerhuensis]|uniref:Bacterio-opsin activator n=2 Tax=Natronolimnobius baerhuensis TaxID=253108 RepID=A0A202EBV5_9EURY|nr:helix-turn-helix domain-containing protein [Natronolimnobius baerhuensis]OVE85724.1 bacterio-opsin activator [Natronolimnobius baerhuensis]
MSVIATVSIPATAFPLGSMLDSDLDVTVTVETTVPTSEGIIPYLWVPLEALESVHERLENESLVDAVAIIDRLEDNALLKIDWNEQVNGILEAIRQNEAIVTSAVGTASTWTFRLRFPTYDALSSFYTTCTNQNISVELVQLHEAVTQENQRRFGLTTPQRTLIVAAYEAGYFDVPRETTLVDLGERLEISDSAVSQRLRRGLAALIDSTLAAGSRSTAETAFANGGLDDEYGPTSEYTRADDSSQ